MKDLQATNHALVYQVKETKEKVARLEKRIFEQSKIDRSLMANMQK